MVHCYVETFLGARLFYAPVPELAPVVLELLGVPALLEHFAHVGGVRVKDI